LRSFGRAARTQETSAASGSIATVEVGAESTVQGCGWPGLSRPFLHWNAD
jgi:hypothetical protein